ncbi:MAG: hypothetical protein M3P93_11250 [Actinomycetota bacterium]|nr:hypothetical protein [Actinomycetota bacterium]
MIRASQSTVSIRARVCGPVHAATAQACPAGGTAPRRSAALLVLLPPPAPLPVAPPLSPLSVGRVEGRPARTVSRKVPGWWSGQREQVGQSACAAWRAAQSAGRT